MDPRLSALLDKAFHRAPAMEANQAISEVRAQQSDDFTEALSYEILLPADKPVEHLVGYVLSRMVYFFESRGAKLPACPGIFVSLFVGDQLYFVSAPDLVAALSEMSGLSVEEMVKRHGLGNS
ncbi:MAG TPA: STAUR_1299 family protein [Myxococcaceae bacterium]|nr:STAUR_1299 family protein [Myxococcaceae bacterium]